MSKPVRPAAQTEQHSEEKDLCQDAGQKVVRVSITEVESDDSWSSDEDEDPVTRNRLTPLEEVAPAEESGLSHSGGPEAEMEEAVSQPAGAGASIGPASHGEARQAHREGKGFRILIICKCS